MKTLIFLFISILFLGSCKQNDILDYNIKDAYISFAYPDLSYKPINPFLDSINYSFATDPDMDIQSKTIAIPVKIAGIASDQIRTFSFEIDTASKYDPSLVKISEPVIREGKYVDTLNIQIKRGKELLTQEMNLILNLKSNDNFKVGNQYNSKFKIAFNDYLNRPNWWNTWERYLGPYYKEVYQQWMQVYYLGADMSPDLYTQAPGPVYYWNNMPTSASSTSYPVTFKYISVLKKYFLENEVYPNGDHTLQRILIP